MRVSFPLIRENDLAKATKQVPVSSETGGCAGWYYLKGVFKGQDWDIFKIWEWKTLEKQCRPVSAQDTQMQHSALQSSISFAQNWRCKPLSVRSETERLITEPPALLVESNHLLLHDLCLLGVWPAGAGHHGWVMRPEEGKVLEFPLDWGFWWRKEDSLGLNSNRESWRITER